MTHYQFYCILPFVTLKWKFIFGENVYASLPFLSASYFLASLNFGSCFGIILFQYYVILTHVSLQKYP